MIAFCRTPYCISPPTHGDLCERCAWNAMYWSLVRLHRRRHIARVSAPPYRVDRLKGKKS